MNLDDLLKSIREEDDDSKGGKINADKFKTKSFKNPLVGQKFKAPGLPTERPVVIKVEPSKLIPKDEGASKEIVEKLDELIDVIKKDNELEKKEQDYDRKKDAKVKREKREKRIESKKLFANSAIVKKSVKKIEDIFNTILKFLGFTLLGQIIKFVTDFLADPKNKGFIENTQEFIRSIPGKLKEAREKIQGVIDWFKGTVEEVKKFTKDFRELLKNAPFLGDLFKTQQEKDLEREVEEERRQGQREAGGDVLQSEPFGGLFNSGGGMIPFLGTDTVPAMLTPGEFIMSRGAVNMFGADTLMAMNKAGGGTNIPKYGLVPGFSGGGIVPMSDMQRKALDVLAKYESKGSGDYNAINQYGDKEGRGNKYTFPDGSTTFAGDYRNAPFNPSKKPLTSLTVGDILKLQYDDGSLSMRQWADQGKLHAVGKYQIIGNTLPGLVDRAKVPLSAKFDEKAQDILALQLMKERGITPWVGPSDKALPPERAIVEAARKDPIPTYVKPVEKTVASTPPPVTSAIEPTTEKKSVDDRFSGFDLDFIFKPIRRFLGVDTPNVPTKTSFIVLPTIKETAQQPSTQVGNEIPNFKISSGVRMRGLVGKALGIEDLVS